MQTINRPAIEIGDAFVLLCVCNSMLSFQELDKWNLQIEDNFP
jgi:hypothetical protein